MSGFTPDQEIVVLSDVRKEFELESLYNHITEGFTVEDKAPKLVITTNYTISATHRSDRRRLWFAPLSTFFGEQQELTGKASADFHGRLYDKRGWSQKDWSAFYTTCI